MPHKSNNQDTALVQVYEREFQKGVRFYLHYTLGGEQIRESLKNIPLVPKKDRIAYRGINKTPLNHTLYDYFLDSFHL